MSAAIIYSAATGRVRRIIVPSGNVPTHSGELVVTVTDAQYQAFAGNNQIQAFVNTLTGKSPSGDRYVSVDANNNVLGAFIADPLCGDVAPQVGATFTAHATANSGDLLWGGTLLPKQPLGIKRSQARNYPLP